MDNAIHDRRALLTTRANPDARLDYVASLKGRVAGKDDGLRAEVGLRYIPDKLIVDPVSFQGYLDSLADSSWDSLEEMAVTVLNDFNNEVVARWTQVSVSASKDKASHNVMVEDRQPHWDNPDLLSRLKRY